LKSFDATEEEKKGFFGFFKKQGDKIEEMKTRYNKVETNVDKIADSLESHQVTLLKDIAVLDKMYELNSAYFRELTLYIAAGKKKLEETRAGEVAELIAKAQATGLQEDAQAAKDLEDQCDRLEKKIYDLELTRTISMQMGPQIRLIQNSDTQMVEKIQSTIVNTIPLWKSQMVLALGMEHANQAAKAQEAVTNLTNSLLKKNAEQLHMASVESAKQAERGIVDIETLTQTNQQLISTLDEVMRIQNEGHEKRVAAEGELANIERELKDKLLEIAKS
ncbi:MAG: toxic anion resistance protein, partial [Lachnospiraceae bacterium]|nr:toxic anion resistance protein [Lachnospiraceae bacterium]